MSASVTNRPPHKAALSVGFATFPNCALRPRFAERLHRSDPIIIGRLFRLQLPIVTCREIPSFRLRPPHMQTFPGGRSSKIPSYRAHSHCPQAEATLHVIHREFERLRSSMDLKAPEVQQKIVARVTEEMQARSRRVGRSGMPVDATAIVAATTNAMSRRRLTSLALRLCLRARSRSAIRTSTWTAAVSTIRQSRRICSSRG